MASNMPREHGMRNNIKPYYNLDFLLANVITHASSINTIVSPYMP